MSLWILHNKDTDAGIPLSAASPVCPPGITRAHQFNFQASLLLYQSLIWIPTSSPISRPTLPVVHLPQDLWILESWVTSQSSSRLLNSGCLQFNSALVVGCPFFTRSCTRCLCPKQKKKSHCKLHSSKESKDHKLPTKVLSAPLEVV